ncbi:TRAP transporter large permease [Acetomicrobium mobile]|uniref:TRAP transporter large permease n=1 Tax=Acetomicrobium mobile TaxID=97477 RepID=UPI0026F1C25A|nr:TRAP transporter large permease [Acetomicrobium mobile]
MEILLLFVLLTFGLFIGVPIGISICLATALTLFFTSHIPLIIIAQDAFAALDSFPLLAIPFFILAGSLMSSGGISKRLVALAESMVGDIAGGLGMVTVIACMFFGAISGSAVATVSAIGMLMIPAMRKKYPESFGAALTAASGIVGVLIPPSIPFVIYGVVSGASVGQMFIAGIIPGILVGLGFMVICYYVAKRRNFPATKDEVARRGFWRNFIDSFWALMIPVIILGGIYAGIFSPTEAAVVAVVYGLIVGKFVYKELTFKSLFNIFSEASLVNGATSFMIGLSMAFAHYLAMEQIPQKIGMALSAISNNMIVVMLLIIVFLLIVGCFIDNISSTIILTPIFLPVMKNLGMDPIHFGIVLTVALATGFVTPPYGCNLFVASAISNVSIERMTKEMIPFILYMVLLLVILTVFPSLSLCLVDLLYR